MKRRSYKFTVPPTHDVGSYSGTCTSSLGETYRQNALSDYNSVRAHDGHPPLFKMPNGTTYTSLYEWEVQQWSSGGWECVYTATTRAEAASVMKDYRINTPMTLVRARRVNA
jgi:hypothetical protein